MQHKSAKQSRVLVYIRYPPDYLAPYVKAQGTNICPHYALLSPAATGHDTAATGRSACRGIESFIGQGFDLLGESIQVRFREIVALGLHVG